MVFNFPVDVKDGHYVAPQAHGWGLEMDQEFFDDHIYPTGKIWRERVQSGSIKFLP